MMCFVLGQLANISRSMSLEILEYANGSLTTFVLTIPVVGFVFHRRKDILECKKYVMNS